MTDSSVTQYNPHNMYQNYGYYPAFRGATVPAGVGYNNVPQMTLQPDTVSFSANGQIQDETKKQGLSNGAKWGICTGVVLGLGALAYVLTKGKVKSNSLGTKELEKLVQEKLKITELPACIEFKEAKTIEEIEAKIAAAQAEAKAIKAEIAALGKQPKTTKVKALTPQYDFLDEEAKMSIDALSSWEVKDEWRDVSTAEKIAIDTETYDPDLKTAGSGWARGTGHLCGVSIAAKFGDEIWSNYYPINHRDTNNFEAEKVIAYITKCLTSCKKKIFANAEYDMGWLNRYGVPLHAFLATGPIDDVLAKAVLVDETWMSHSLDNVGAFYCNEKKDETLLHDPRVQGAFGMSNAKSDLWKLPAKFVGPYAEQDAVLTLKADDALEPFIKAHPLTGKSLEQVYDLERRLIPMLFEMHKRGVKVDVDRADQIKAELTAKSAEIKKRLNDMAGIPINIMSGDDLGSACDILGIEYPRTLKLGKPSFTADFLENHESEFLRLVREARKIDKVSSTFVDAIREKAINGRIYPQLNALKRTEGEGATSGTITGRFSCVKPNLQQVSSRDKVLAPIVRSMFLPDEGYLWGNFDYSQQEPRMTIHIAAMLHRNGTVGLDRIEEAVKRFNDNPRTDNHQMVADLAGITRREAKTINLGLSYGMGAVKLCHKLGLPTEYVNGREVAGKEGKDLMKLFNQKIPYLKGFMNCASNLAQQRGAVTTLLGRHSRYNLWTAKNFDLSRTLGMRPKEDIEHEIEQMGKDSKWHGVSLVRAATFSAMNHIVQGSSADQTKQAMLTVYENKIVLPYTQIHDALDCPIDRSRPIQHCREIKDAMVHAMELCVPTVVDVELGETWGSIEKVEV